MRRGGHWPVLVPDPRAGPVKRGTVRRVIGAFRPYKKQVSIVAVAIFVTSALGVVNPLLIKVIFDTALCPHRIVGGNPVTLPVQLHRLFWLVGLMGAIPIVSGIIGVGQTYLANVIGQRLMQDCPSSPYRHLRNRRRS